MKRNWRASWWGWKREWKSWLKTQHSKNKNHGIGSHHFMANRWGKSENSDRFYFLGFQNHCHHEIKRHLLLGRKAMANLDSVLKGRDITLPTKAIIKAMIFPVVMYGCESWTKLCWIRPLRVPWTARSNQSILKEINPEDSLEGLMLKLKLQ